MAPHFMVLMCGWKVVPWTLKTIGDDGDGGSQSEGPPHQSRTVNVLGCFVAEAERSGGPTPTPRTDARGRRLRASVGQGQGSGRRPASRSCCAVPCPGPVDVRAGSDLPGGQGFAASGDPRPVACPGGGVVPTARRSPACVRLEAKGPRSVGRGFKGASPRAANAWRRPLRLQGHRGRGAGGPREGSPRQDLRPCVAERR